METAETPLMKWIFIPKQDTVKKQQNDRQRKRGRERDSERKSVWRIMTAESRTTHSKNVNSPKKAAKIKSQHQQKWNPNPKFCACLFPSSSAPPSILSSVNGPQRVKNANPKSKLSAVALHVATWQPPSPRPRPPAHTHQACIYE